MNRERGYATLLLDVKPGTRFPEHHHAGAEECYVISGSVYTYGRRMGPGDFLHADGGTDHGELWTDEGAQVLLVVPPEDYMPDPDLTSSYREVCRPQAFQRAGSHLFASERRRGW